MIFSSTKLKDAYLINIEPLNDERGFFARSWCKKEFEMHGLNSGIAQANIAFSTTRATLRGLHYQLAPYEETKLVRCTRGAIYDVIVDLRRDSPTYKKWLGVELTAENHLMLYVPEGFAHGYLTLADNTEICYQASLTYARAYARGVRYDDQAFGISWPLPVDVISDTDQGWPPYTE